MSAPAARGRRLLIAATSCADAEAALPFAAPLLGAGPRRLAGLMVDEGTAALAVSAAQRLVLPGGALRALPDAEAARFWARGEARGFRDRLAALAGKLGADWSFDTAAGDMVAGACAALGREDLLLLGHRPLGPVPGRVLLIAGGRSAMPRTLAAALARARSTEVREPSAAGTAADLLARLDRSRAAAVVVDTRSAPFRDAAALRLVFAAARCPVLVLGGGRIDDAGRHGTRQEASA
ncbi:MAG: hypothetical protein NXH83_15115 [Rhodobacteraceae bacterium]|nr:hypothetical protein [Paracoccaceae bacterium]